ncbi:MAG: hypothetical protein Q8S54_19260 [Bacteroidota bacterium]|nr:hypothetical protein [Odoribacter sp.]MDP3645310.1 hypothetical protein [Bacteroidota bacterium]
MKKIVSALLFILTLFSGFDALSQNPDRLPLVHQRMVQAKLREIRFQLNLDQATFEQFRPVYLKYEREISGIDFRNLARMMKVDADSLSSEEADRLVVNQMETARKLISIRERYYKEFRTVLSPQQIIKLYQTEADVRKKVMQEMKRRMMSR